MVRLVTALLFILLVSVGVSLTLKDTREELQACGWDLHEATTTAVQASSGFLECNALLGETVAKYEACLGEVNYIVDRMEEDNDKLRDLLPAHWSDEP